MKRSMWSAAALLSLLPGCAGPEPEPVLSAPLVYVREGYSEQAGVIGYEGRVEITVKPEGRVDSIVRRKLFEDVKRKGWLTPEQREELRARVAEWTSKETPIPPLKGRFAGSLSLGEKKVEWTIDQKLPPEFVALAHFLESLLPDLPKERRSK